MWLFEPRFSGTIQNSLHLNRMIADTIAAENQRSTSSLFAYLCRRDKKSLQNQKARQHENKNRQERAGA
jgi:hypothetical protein